MLLAPVFRYSHARDAFVLRAVGNDVGPVLRLDRRVEKQPFGGSDRRRSRARPRRARVA